MSWIENWLNGQVQKTVISSTKSQRPVASKVFQGSVLGPVLFNIFIDYLNGGVEFSISRSADDMKWGDWLTRDRAVLLTRGRDSLERWDDRNLMGFS